MHIKPPAITGEPVSNEIEQHKDFKEVRVPKGEIGETGTVVLDGIVTPEEYSAELAGKQGLTEWERMRRSDGTVKSALLAVKMPLLGAEWFVQPASQSKEDREIAAVIEHNLMSGMTRTWQQTLRELLRYLDYGVFVYEKVFFNYEYDGKEYIGIKKLAPRLPRTIDAWVTEDGKDGITQFTDDGKKVSIPMEKLLIFINDMTGSDWWGESLLRPAYKHWKMKETLYNIDAIKHERQGLGIPYFKRPANSSSKDRVKAKNFVKHLRAHENMHLEWPEGWEFGFMDMNVNTTTDVMPSVEHHDAKIVQSVLAQFLNLGQQQSGSWALSRDHSSLFYLSLKAVAEYVAEVINRHLIKQIVDLNFLVDEYPRLEFKGLGAIDFNTYSLAIQRLQQASMLNGDVATEQHLRESMGLPLLDEKEVELRRKAEMEKAKNPTPAPSEPNPKPNDDVDDSGLEDEKVNANERKKIIKSIAEHERALHEFIEQNI